jgi:hypothetical protein
MLEEVHGIDSSQFQLVTNHLDIKRISAVPHQNIVFHDLLKRIPWAKFDLLVEQHHADWDDRVIKTKAHLIALLYAQVAGARSLREIETTLKTHAGKALSSRRQHHIEVGAVDRQCLASCRSLYRLAVVPDGHVAGQISAENP